MRESRSTIVMMLMIYNIQPHYQQDTPIEFAFIRYQYFAMHSNSILVHFPVIVHRDIRRYCSLILQPSCHQMIFHIIP